MTMKSQTNKKDKKTKRNVKRSALIKFRLSKKEITQTQIARELGITITAVNRAISGLSKIARVDNWLKENLGV